MIIHKANLLFRSLIRRLTTTRIIYHHIGTVARQTVEVIHNFHKNTRGWAGIGYHFYIRRNGDIWEGRPLEMQGAHAGGANFDSIGVAFEGNLETESLTQEQINRSLWLQAHLIELYGPLEILQHRDVGATACAGRNFPIATFRNVATAPVQAPQTRQRIFIERVAAVAVTSARIVPSIIIAQAILESGWGTSRLATVANALFGIKADHRWTGRVVNVDTWEVCNGVDITINAAFRAYDSWEDSIRDHQSFLLTSAIGGVLRYEAAFDNRVYAAAAWALQNGGYATDPNYANKLINIIRREGLTEFDRNWVPAGSTDEGDDEMINVQNVAGGTWKRGTNPNNHRWWYDLGRGQFPANGLFNINGKTYHFDAQGWMSTGAVVLGRNRFIFEQTPGDAREGALMRIE